MSGTQGSPEAQDYNEQLPMRMAAPAAGAQPAQGQSADTTTRPDRLPAQLSAPVNDPTQPMLTPTGFDATTVGDAGKTNWSDYAKSAWQRVEGMGAAALGAASLTARKMGADPDTIQHIEQMRQGVAQSVEDSINSMTPAAQKALHASVFGGQDENGEHIPTPGEVGWSRFLALNAASFVPDAVLAAVTARAGGAAAPAILGSVYGTLQAGEGYSKLVDEVDKSKPQDWANSPVMQSMLQQGMSFDDAKKQIVDHAANQLGALNFGIGALTGAGGMGLLMKGPLGSVGKTLLSRLGLGAGEGAVTMGLQSGGQEFAQENATNQVGLTSGFDTDKLARAAASGALGGIVLGAAGGALHGAHEASPAALSPNGEETANPGPTTGLVSPELQAALDLGDAGTGFVRGQPQGELFRSTEQANQGGNQNLPPASGGPRPAAMGEDQLALSVDTPQPAKMAPPGFAGQDQQGQLFRTQAEMQANPQQPLQRPQPTQAQPELMARPGTVGADPQGQLFRTAEEANVPSGSGNGSGAAGSAAVGTAAPASGADRPSAGMSRGDLLDALKTMPNQDPKALARMTKGDLATAYDKASGPAQPTVAPSTPEPQRDIDAQMAAVADKSNPKDALFVAKGSPEPTSKPKGVFKSTRDEGTLYTTNAKKVAAFRKSDLSDESLGKLLGYTESKTDAIKSGAPTVVQAKDAQGAVVHEQLASPEGVKDAQAAASERMPEGGTVTVTTPEEVQNRRAQEAAQAPAEPPTTRDEPKAETPPATPAAPVTVADKLRAQRAARKAAMAPPGERMKGEVATVEAPTGKASEKAPQTSDNEPKTHDQAMADVEKGVREFKVQPLKKGADITRAMNTVIQELTDKLKGTKTEGDVAETVAKWARSNTNPLPGTTTRRIDIGNHVVQLLTGKSVDEYSGRAQRVRSELAREPAPEVRYEADANREDITEGERTVTHAVESPTTVVEKEPTKIVDQLPHWLGRVLSGDMSVHEAHETYGLPKGNGRPRKYATFADYLDDRIRMAEDPKVEEDLRARLTELKDMPTSQAKSAETNRINQLLETTGKDAADRLRELKAELDPAKAAADEVTDKPQTAAEKLRARLEQIRGGGDRQTNADEGKSLINRLTALAPKVNEWMKANGYDEKFGDSILKIDRNKIMRIVEEHLAGGHEDFDRMIDRMSSFKADRYSWDEKVPDMQKWVTDAHNWLEKIDQTNEKLIHNTGKEFPNKGWTEVGPSDALLRPSDMPHVNASVDKLLDDGKPRPLSDYLTTIANDPAVRRVTPNLAALAQRMIKMVKDDVNVVPGLARPGDAGTVFQGGERGTGYIGMALDRRQSRVETLIHEGLHSITSHYIESLPPGHVDAQALRAMSEELRRAANDSILDNREMKEIAHALSNSHELHTMLMTNPTLQSVAASHPVSPQFVDKMRTLGFGAQVKSVWAAFTAFVRKALGLKGPQTAADASMFDHVLRPLQDIAERAAEYNKAADQRSPQEVMQHMLSMPNMHDATRTAIEKIDPAGMSDKARRFWLLNSPLDHIVKWNHDLFEDREAEAPGNSLERFRTATEAVTARSKAFHDSYADTVSDLVKKVAGPDREKLAQLMNDATIANVQLGQSADNGHVTTVGQQDQLRALQSRYAALSPDARGAYDSVRDYYTKTYREERDAQLSGMLKAVMPEATPAHIRAMTEATRTMEGIERMLSDQGDSNVARAFGDAYDGNRKLLRAITKVHKLGFVQGDYFPLRRFGDYVLRYGSKESGDYGVEMFERRSEADARRVELLKQNQSDLSQVLDKRESNLRSMLPESNVVSEITDAMQSRPELREHTDEVRDLINSILLQHATHSERARQSMRRRGVQGASTDIERVLAKDFLATSSRIGYLENGASRSQALADMRRDSDNLGRNGAAGEQIRAQSVVNELEKRMPSGDDASGFITGAARRFSSLGFIQSLMSPSHMLTSTIEAHMNSTAVLGARHGTARASLAIGKALRDASPALGAGARNTMNALAGKLKAADWNLSTVVRDSMIKRGGDRGAMTDLFNKLNAAGLIDHTAIREMQRIANMGAESRRGKALDWWGRFMDLNAAGAHAVDVANKSAIAKAAYDLELAKTKSHDAAVKYAVEMARTAMPNYNQGNKARISTNRGPLGGLAGPMTQFKQYGINMYAMMGNLVRSSIHGATGQERMEARKAFAGILATHTLMAGSLTLLGDPLRWIGGLYDWATGAPKPHDYENDVRSWMADAFGPEAGEVLARGLPHLAGIDIHRRVGLANLLEPPELKSFDKKGYAEAVVSAMTGAAGEDATTMAGGFSKLLGGDIMGGLKDLVPRPVRDAMKAQGLAEKGVTDSKGQTVLPPEKLSGFDVAAQAVGFQPSTVSEFREGRNAILEAREEASTEHNHLIQSWVRADPDDRADMADDIQAYNVRNPGQKITADTLLKAAKQHRDAMRESNAATFGLTLPKKARSYLSGAGGFANVGQ